MKASVEGVDVVQVADMEVNPIPTVYIASDRNSIYLFLFIRRLVSAKPFSYLFLLLKPWGNPLGRRKVKYYLVMQM